MDEQLVERVVEYNPSPTLSKFHASNALVRGIKGPIGSGKSVGCCWEIWSRAQEQRAFEGVRRSRWVATRNCFDDQTEILTETRGWQLFRDLIEGERVAQLADDGSLEFVTPTMYYSAPYTGRMVGFQNEGVDFLVTPDHRLNVSKKTTRAQAWGEYHFATADECFGNPRYRVKRDAAWVGANPRGFSPAMFEWLGFWFAEGYAGRYEYADRKEPHWRCTISQSKDLDYVRGLFDRAGLAYTEIQAGDGKQFKLRISEATKPLVAELATTGDALTKRAPQWIKDAPPEHLRAFIAGYVRGDGSVRKDCGTMTACTASRGMADDLQEMALRAGRVANITLKARAGTPYEIGGHAGKTNADYWCVTFVKEAKHQPALVAGGYAAKYRGWYEQHYTGTVYCVEVPTHRVYVRRNGKAHWSSQTYGELTTTTLQTWLDWFPEDRFGKVVYGAPITHTLTWEADDGTRVELEMWFLALDRPEHVKKLLSLEISGAWMNEAREQPKAILDGLTGRVGRFPKASDGGCTWSGVILDTNPPDDDHWWYALAEEGNHEGYEFFSQPPGDSDDAENLDWLLQTPESLKYPVGHPIRRAAGREYYERLKAGKTEQWIRVYVKGQYGTVQDGKPVYTEWNDTLHTKEIQPLVGVQLKIGLDFGLTPAAVFTQTDARGRLLVVDELCGEDMGIRQFLEDLLIPHLVAVYPTHWKKKDEMILLLGDPAGEQKAQTDERSCFDEVKAKKLKIRAAKSNAWLPRRGAVAWFLSKLAGGQPMLLLDPCCGTLRKGFNGGYKYRRIKVSGEERFTDEPMKNKYSHPHDALQYAAMESGGIQALQSQGRTTPRTRAWTASVPGMGPLG